MKTTRKNQTAKFNGHQDIYVHRQRDGKIIPTLVQEVYAGDSGEPFFVNEVPLSKVLDTVVSYKTIGQSMKKEDKEDLLSQFDAIIEIIQQKKEQVMKIPEWKELQQSTKKKP